MMRFYRMLKPGLWAMRLPLVGALLQRAFIQPDADANWFIPVGESIPAGTQVILPGAVVERLLEEADDIFAMAACPCRTAFACTRHPRDLGCLHLGPVTRRISTDLGRMLTREEGRAHLQRALDSGLLPTILHLESDAVILGVEKSRMLSICFCCECCCDVRLLLRQGPDRYWDLYNHRMPGVSVAVDASRCTGCGECVAACYGGSRVITLADGKAVIGGRCIACGRCVPACPAGAISLHLDAHIDLLDALMERISSRTNIHS